MNLYRILEETRKDGITTYKIQSSHNGKIWLDIYDRGMSLKEAREEKKRFENRQVVSTRVVE